MAKILVSHAHADAGWAARLHARLAAAYGDEAVFSDVADIPSTVGAPGVAGRVSGLDAVVAVIGPGWHDQMGDDRDLVAELDAALRRGIPVVPVLVDGTLLPAIDTLPVELRSLPARPALAFDGADEGGLEAELARLGVPPPAAKAAADVRAQAAAKPRLALVIAAALLVLGIAIAVLMAGTATETNGWVAPLLAVRGIPG